jgi:hypothetical protein
VLTRSWTSSPRPEALAPAPAGQVVTPTAITAQAVGEGQEVVGFIPPAADATRMSDSVRARRCQGGSRLATLALVSGQRTQALRHPRGDGERVAGASDRADREVTARAWPQIQADLDRLIKIAHWTSDQAAMGELASAVTGELHGAYLRLPQQRREVLLGLINHVDHQTARRPRTAEAGSPQRPSAAPRHWATRYGGDVRRAFPQQV